MSRRPGFEPLEPCSRRKPTLTRRALSGNNANGERPNIPRAVPDAPKDGRVACVRKINSFCFVCMEWTLCELVASSRLIWGDSCTLSRPDIYLRLCAASQ